MTDAPIHSQPSVEKPDDKPGLRRFRELTTTLTRKEVDELRAKLAAGWNPLAERPANPPTKERAKTPEVPALTLAEELFHWIDETLLEHLGLNPRALADLALKEFLTPPCSREVLIEFFRAFAEAYERMLWIRVDLGSPLTKAIANHITSLAFACLNQDDARNRLKRLTSLAAKSPEAADLFRLTEFAGCTPQEVAKYLRMPEPEVARQAKNRRFDICGSSSPL